MTPVNAFQSDLSWVLWARHPGVQSCPPSEGPWRRWGQTRFMSILLWVRWGCIVVDRDTPEVTTSVSSMEVGALFVFYSVCVCVCVLQRCTAWLGLGDCIMYFVLLWHIYSLVTVTTLVSLLLFCKISRVWKWLKKLNFSKAIFTILPSLQRGWNVSFVHDLYVCMYVLVYCMYVFCIVFISLVQHFVTLC